MMLEMLPLDLSFTVFIPTETSFKRDLGLEWNESSTIEEKDNVVAIVSRVLGFSSVARKVRADSVVIGELVEYESVSGFRVGVYRGLDGVLVVNGVRVVEMDLEVGEVVVHLIDGVVMDAAFEQSVRPDNDDGVGDDDGKEEGCLVSNYYPKLYILSYGFCNMLPESLPRIMLPSSCLATPAALYHTSSFLPHQMKLSSEYLVQQLVDPELAYVSIWRGKQVTDGVLSANVIRDDLWMEQERQMISAQHKLASVNISFIFERQIEVSRFIQETNSRPLL
ncbi:hypothetical protein AKJ16_DCAP09515 [Drosera capensis]